MSLNIAIFYETACCCQEHFRFRASPDVFRALQYGFFFSCQRNKCVLYIALKLMFCRLFHNDFVITRSIQYPQQRVANHWTTIIWHLFVTVQWHSAHLLCSSKPVLQHPLLNIFRPSLYDVATAQQKMHTLIL